jgi:hypothetical protein
MMNKTRTCNAGRIGKALILLILMTVADVRGQYVNTVVSSSLFEPNSVAVDPNNDVFVRAFLRRIRLRLGRQRSIFATSGNRLCARRTCGG